MPHNSNFLPCACRIAIVLSRGAQPKQLHHQQHGIIETSAVRIFLLFQRSNLGRGSGSHLGGCSCPKSVQTVRGVGAVLYHSIIRSESPTKTLPCAFDRSLIKTLSVLLAYPLAWLMSLTVGTAAAVRSQMVFPADAPRSEVSRQVSRASSRAHEDRVAHKPRLRVSSSLRGLTLPQVLI